MTDAPRFLAFDAVADDYDKTRVIPDDARAQIARQCAQIAGLERGGGLFLDAGVGTGRFGAPLAKLHPGKIVGVDISRPMLARAREKEKKLTLSVADLQRLPFGNDTFAGALIVHILHLIAGWKSVLDELRRVLKPDGVLLIGSESGARSAIIDFYYERARAQGMLAAPLGAPGMTQAATYLKSADGGRASIQEIRAPIVRWKRAVTVGETLDALARRTYSQMWNIPDDAHQELLADAARFAAQKIGSRETIETQDARFILAAVRWPSKPAGRNA